MKRRQGLILTISLALLVAALPAMAQPGGRGAGRGPGFMDGHRLEHLALRLDLSDGQREELKAAYAERFAAATETRSAMREARLALRDAIQADSFDEAVVRQAAATVAALEADRAVERAKHAQRVRQVLTPEQYAELEEMRSDRRRFGRRGARGRGRGFGGQPPVGG